MKWRHANNSIYKGGSAGNFVPPTFDVTFPWQNSKPITPFGFNSEQQKVQHIEHYVTSPIPPSTALMTADTEVQWGNLQAPYNAMQGVRILALHQCLQGGETSIEVDDNVTVYYAHDDTNGEKPSWLTGGEGWTDTTDTFTPSDGVEREIWQRAFTADVQYDFTWAHSDFKKRGSFLIGGFMVPTGVVVTVRPALYEVVNITSYVAPANDAIYWDGVPVISGETSYATVALLNTAITTANDGDVLTLEAGTHTADILISGRTGITVAADVFGSVLLEGQISITGSTRCIFTGFTLPPTNVFQDKIIVADSSTWCRVTNNFFDGCDFLSDFTKEDSWIRIKGNYNRVDHNTFADKTSGGSEIKNSSQTALPFGNRNDHNYIDNHFIRNDNIGNSEIIKVGNSPENNEFALNLIDHNQFDDYNSDQNNNETEIFTIKSDGNVIWANFFLRCYGTVSHRVTAGTFNLANRFDGLTKTESGGYRVLGSTNGGDHVFALNYFENLNSANNEARSCVTLARTNETNRFTAEDCLYVSNIAKDCGRGLAFRAGTGATVVDTQHFEGEAYDCSQAIEEVVADADKQTYAGSVMNAPLGITPTPSGITVADPLLVDRGDGIFEPTNASVDPGINTQWPDDLSTDLTTGKTW